MAFYFETDSNTCHHLFVFVCLMLIHLCYESSYDIISLACNCFALSVFCLTIQKLGNGEI